ncbi:MAG: NAD(P)-binding domain-containing protein, partial [Gemmatimonadetes bacterium]|nr:NAD(P)-binding domain-containing protein [Gemmatimonadota bacterium]
MSHEGPSLPETVGIVGLGVMGGSLARALAARGVAVFGYTPDPSEGAAALEAGAVRELRSTAAASARDVECWVVATPLAAFGGIFEAAAGAVPSLIMDVGSLQG